MLVELTVISLTALAVTAAWQAVWAGRFASLFGRGEVDGPRPDELPRAAVILAVRGADPSLADCLDGLLRQDYPHYDVHVVIDSPTDPGRAVVERVAGHSPRVHVSYLDPRPTCSLKLSALVQAVGALDDSVGAVALIDADVVPHPGWLRDLVAALAAPGVGAATGFRWYRPARCNPGSLVRYLWGVAACTQMYAFDIPWGGSLAFRAELFRAANLSEQWARAFCEDTAFYRVLHDRGLRLRFLPSVTMVNRESIDLRSCF